MKHLDAASKNRSKNMAELNVAYHHYNEIICQLWYEKNQKNKKKGVQFPVSIEANVAKECNYDTNDKITSKTDYHVVPNVSYKNILDLVKKKEKESHYKDPTNARQLLEDLTNVKDKKEFTPLATEVLKLDERTATEKENKNVERKEKRKLNEAISKIQDRESKKVVLNKLGNLEARIEVVEKENEKLKKNQLDKIKGENHAEEKAEKRKRGWLRKYDEVVEAEQHTSKNIRQQYQRFSKAVGEIMANSVDGMKGGKEDVEGTLNAGLQYLSSKQPQKIHQSELHIISTLRDSIRANRCIENKTQAISITSLAVHQMKDYSMKEIAEHLKIPKSQVKGAIKHAKTFFPGAPLKNKKRISSIRISWDRILSFCGFMADSAISYEETATKANRESNITHILRNSRSETCELYKLHMQKNYPSLKLISRTSIMKYLCSKQFRRQKAEECCCTKCVAGDSAFHDLSAAVEELNELAQKAVSMDYRKY